ncbi:hypothetical protein [Rhizobium sp. BT-175]|uniref:hypothetical protein n=1 Tax=Rhizobium sp. BT-175 TaxID=2986929 RepID=UPI002235E2A6|nr:hypothetical protein [Rhizobium sp. BT-175]MCV9947454.1 hypothetical protein [Rhizobium sp. BT-175]
MTYVLMRKREFPAGVAAVALAGIHGGQVMAALNDNVDVVALAALRPGMPMAGTIAGSLAAGQRSEIRNRIASYLIDYELVMWPYAVAT